MRELSILIPARNEMFLKNTVEDILDNIEADTEIIVVLDGQWPAEGLPQNERLKVIYLPNSIGQRAATNLACKLSKAKYVMKVDAHCSFDKGFDRIMIENMQDDWTMVPIMRNLHAFDWVCDDGHRRYQGPSGECKECGKETKREIIWIAKPSPQSTSYCFDKTLHFQYFGEYKAKQIGDLVETMSLQGSCWMLTRKKYWELNICDEKFGSWGQQGVEVALKTWLSGGRVVCNKKTWYAHMFRTQGGDFGFPFPITGQEVEKARQYSRDLFLNNKWDKAKYDLDWLIKKFNPPYWRETKGIIYYTDNQCKVKIAKKTQGILNKTALPITSVSLKPMKHFGKNIYLPLKKGTLTYFTQILTALENINTDIVFFCEHDVWYHPSHFDFIPPSRDKFYYNTNVWKMRYEDGFGVKVDSCQQVSGICCYKELALGWYINKLKEIEKSGFDRHYEPEPRENWQSEYPNLDIRHENNKTKNRWDKEEFKSRKYIKGWIETNNWKVDGWTEEDLRKIKE